MGLARFVDDKQRRESIANSPKYIPNLYIAPYSFTIKFTGYGLGLYYRPVLKITRRIKVSLDELKAIQDIQCKVSYRQ